MNLDALVREGGRCIRRENCCDKMMVQKVRSVRVKRTLIDALFGKGGRVRDGQRRELRGEKSWCSPCVLQSRRVKRTPKLQPASVWAEKN